MERLNLNQMEIIEGKNSSYCDTILFLYANNGSSWSEEVLNQFYTSYETYCIGQQ